MRTNSRTRLLRGSSSIRWPIMENPWQGAPPNTTSICLRPIPARFLISSPVSPMTDRDSIAHLGKLYACTAQWIGSISTAATISKPACSKPKPRPPAPANKSTPIGLGTFDLLFSNTSLPGSTRLIDRNSTWRPQKGNEPPFQFVAVPRLTLPDGHRAPARAAHCPQVPFVLQAVSLQLWQPELWAGFWRAANAASVRVPKTAVNENHLPPRRENDVGSAW